MTTATLSHNDLLSNPAFHVHVTKAASLAQTCLASDNGRISKAVDLVLAGCVEALGCGRWEVASATSFPEKWYKVYNGGCTCPDYVAHAHLVPNHACKHICAVGIYQKAVQEMEKEHMQYEVPEPTREEIEAMVESENARLDDAQADESLAAADTAWHLADQDELAQRLVDAGRVQRHGATWRVADAVVRETAAGVTCDCIGFTNTGMCRHIRAAQLFQAAQPAPEGLPEWNHEPITPSLPEAPASVNVRFAFQGRDIQLTLRDLDESRLMERLAVVLAQYAPVK